MTGRVDVDPPCMGRRLDGVPGGPGSEHARLGGVQIGDPEIGMGLLRVLLPRPLRRLVVLDLLEGQGRPVASGELYPAVVGRGVVDRPSGDGGVEAGEATRIRAVDGGPHEAPDRGHAESVAHRAR